MWTSPHLEPLQDDFGSIQLFSQSLQFFQCTAENKHRQRQTRVNTAILHDTRCLTCTYNRISSSIYSLSSAELHLSHQVFGHLLFDLNLVFQSRLTKSPINEDLKGFPEAKVVFVETYGFLGLFLSLDLHGGW